MTGIQFDMGDRVRILRQLRNKRIGEVGEVTAYIGTGRDKYEVRFPDGYILWMNLSVDGERMEPVGRPDDDI